VPSAALRVKSEEEVEEEEEEEEEEEGTRVVAVGGGTGLRPPTGKWKAAGPDTAASTATNAIRDKARQMKSLAMAFVCRCKLLLLLLLAAPSPFLLS